MPLNADLYLDQIDLSRHAGTAACEVCRVDSIEELVDRLRAGRIGGGACPHWPRERIEAFRTAVDAGEILPVIPSLQVPRPAEAGLIELNGPADHAPVLITGNSQLTHEVLLAVLSTTAAPMRMLSVDTGGHTVDMSLVYRTLTPEAVVEALKSTTLPPDGVAARIVLPGLAASLVDPVADRLGRPIELGPVCAAELPLFFGSDWNG